MEIIEQRDESGILRQSVVTVTDSLHRQKSSKSLRQTTKSIAEWIKSNLGYKKFKSVADGLEASTTTLRDSPTTFEALSLFRILEINTFLREESEYTSTIGERLRRAANILNLHDNEELMTETVNGILELSKIVSSAVRTDKQLDWTLEMERYVQDYLYLISILRKCSFEPLADPEFVEVQTTLKLPLLRLALYRKLYAITYSQDYWNLSHRTREFVEEYYIYEEQYADKLEKLPEFLNQLLMLGIISSTTFDLGIAMFHQLRLVSYELRTRILLNPNTYGLSHRLCELPDVYQAYSDFLTKAVDDIMLYRQESSAGWYFSNEKYTRKEVYRYIDQLEEWMSRPLDALITYQKYLNNLRSFADIDQCQVVLSLYTVSGIAHELLRKHGYEVAVKSLPI